MKRVCASVLAAALVCGAAEAEAQSPTGGGETVAATPRDKCRLDEISSGVGYVFGNLRKNPVDLEMIPAFTRFGFSINGWLHLDSDVHTVQLAFEPFVIRVFEPAKVGAIGWDLFVRYLQRVAGRLDAYVEIGGGPVYWGLSTYEQGRAGWNFLDQIGGGYRFALSARHGVFAGYRWVHVSRAGLDTESRADKGINANGFVLGYTFRPGR